MCLPQIGRKFIRSPFEKASFFQNIRAGFVVIEQDQAVGFHDLIQRGVGGMPFSQRIGLDIFLFIKPQGIGPVQKAVGRSDHRPGILSGHPICRESHNKGTAHHGQCRPPHLAPAIGKTEIQRQQKGPHGKQKTG